MKIDDVLAEIERSDGMFTMESVRAICGAIKRLEVAVVSLERALKEAIILDDPERAGIQTDAETDAAGRCRNCGLKLVREDRVKR